MNSCPRCGLPHPGMQPCPVPELLPMPETGRPLAPGTVVCGRFRITAVAHRSGMSTVYRAEDLRDEQAPMALKEFNAAGLPSEDRAEALSWLAREAGLLSTLEDPRLPQLVAAA